MGLFAAYCGFVYNDFMSIPLYIFDSCYPLPVSSPHYKAPGNSTHTLESGISANHTHHVQPEMIQFPDCVYPIGVDPAWYMSTNELNFLNSLKMKISVILGVM